MAAASFIELDQMLATADSERNTRCVADGVKFLDELTRAPFRCPVVARSTRRPDYVLEECLLECDRELPGAKGLIAGESFCIFFIGKFQPFESLDVIRD